MLGVILSLLLLNPGDFIASFLGKYIDGMQLGLVLFTTLNHSTIYIDICGNIGTGQRDIFTLLNLHAFKVKKPEMQIQPETIIKHTVTGCHVMRQKVQVCSKQIYSSVEKICSH